MDVCGASALRIIVTTKTSVFVAFHWASAHKSVASAHDPYTTKTSVFMDLPCLGQCTKSVAGANATEPQRFTCAPIWCTLQLRENMVTCSHHFPFTPTGTTNEGHMVTCSVCLSQCIVFCTHKTYSHVTISPHYIALHVM